MSPSQVTPAPAWRWALGLFGLAFLVRLLVLVRFSGSAHFLPDSDDMHFYNQWALRIGRGELTDYQAFYGLPGYAFILAGIYAITGGFNPFAAALIQTLADAGVAVLIYQIAVSVFAPSQGTTSNRLCTSRAHWIGTLAAVSWIAFSPAQTFSIILMPTAYLVLAFYFCLLLLIRTERSSWWRPWLFLGLLCGVVATVVATILFLIPLMVIAIVRSVDPERILTQRIPRQLAAITVLGVAVFVGASPAWIHNRFVAREPVMLSAHSGINFWIGNNPTAVGYPKMPPGIRSTQEGLLKDSITLAEEATGAKMRRWQVSEYWSKRANDYIREHPVAWLRLMRTKFENFWNAYAYDDLSIIKLLRDDRVLPPGLNFGVIAALGLAGLFPTVWYYPRSRWVAAAVLLHMAAVLTVFVTERYRMAAVPGLMILAAAGLWHLGACLVERRWLGAGVYILVAAAAAWFVSIPRADIGLWSLDHYKAGIRATATGNLDRAQQNLETAFAYVQDNPDINFALGNLWLAKSGQTKDEGERVAQRSRAKLFYRRALDLNPRHASTLNNLGVLALEEKRFDLAEKFLVASLQTEPDDAKTFYLIARSRLGRDERAGALAAAERAVQLAPGQPEFAQLLQQIRAVPAPPGAASEVPR
jgi:hypothetical protein